MTLELTEKFNRLNKIFSSDLIFDCIVSYRNSELNERLRVWFCTKTKLSVNKRQSRCKFRGT